MIDWELDTFQSFTFAREFDSTWQSESEQALQDKLIKLDGILGGDQTIELDLQFLIRSNKSDLQILKNTKVFLFFHCKWYLNLKSYEHLIEKEHI